MDSVLPNEILDIIFDYIPHMARTVNRAYLSKHQQQYIEYALNQPVTSEELRKYLDSRAKKLMLICYCPDCDLIHRSIRFDEVGFNLYQYQFGPLRRIKHRKCRLADVSQHFGTSRKRQTNADGIIQYFRDMKCNVDFVTFSFMIETRGTKVPISRVKTNYGKLLRKKSEHDAQYEILSSAYHEMDRATYFDLANYMFSVKAS